MASQRDRSHLAHSSCLGEHQPKHLPNTHTDTHTRHSHYIKTHTNDTAVNEADAHYDCTGKQVPKREAPTSRLGNLPLPTGNTCSLACFRSDLLLSEVSPSSSCGEKPKRKKKKSCSIVSLLSDKLPDHWSKTFGRFDLVCYLLSLVCCFGVCCFSEGSKRTCI